MTSPRVSVITIFYNAEKYLTEAIKSVHNQIFNDWQLILVDDGSQDGSTEIAKHAAQDFPDKVIYYEHDGHVNQGMSASRNAGIRISTGELVAFVDADDVWLPEKLADQVAILDSVPDAAMVYGKARAWYQWNPNEGRTDHYWDLGVTLNQLIHPPTLFLLLMENQVQSPIPSNAMVRRDVLESLGRFEDQFRGIYEDYVFFSKVHLAYPTYVSDKCWLLYRQHPESCTCHDLGENYAKYRLPYLEWLGLYIQSLPKPIAEIAQRAFHRELWRCKHPKLDYLINYVPKRLATLLG
jgi:glycosyltransferase involved in cell wall biosynthesis